MKNEKTIHIRYYALLREERGLSEEAVKTVAQTPKELYKELSVRHHFCLDDSAMKVAVNDVFQSWNTPLKNSDTVVFIPPVAGG